MQIVVRPHKANIFLPDMQDLHKYLMPYKKVKIVSTASDVEDAYNFSITTASGWTTVLEQRTILSFMD